MVQYPARLLVMAAAVVASLDSVFEPSWTSPQETDSSKMAEQQLQMALSPKPTPPPLYGRMKLMPRLEGYTLGPATCGFVQSDGYSITCISNTATCATVSGYLGCCQPNKRCDRIQTSCLDYAASKAGRCNLLSDFKTVCCDSTATACFTYFLTKTGPGSDMGSTYTALGCSSTSGFANLVDYDPAWSRTHSFPPSITSSTDAPSTTSATQTEFATGTGEGGGNGSSTNLGAIIGGAVGGVVALALVGLAVTLLLRRRRNAKVSKAQDSPQTSMAQSQAQSPPPQGYQPAYSPPPQGYDPHASVSSQHTYSPQSGVYQQYPQQFQGQYPPQQYGGYPQYGAAGFPLSPTASPPPHTTPSPNFANGGETNPLGTSPVLTGHHPHQPPPSELPTVASLGNEGNRAELS